MGTMRHFLRHMRTTQERRRWFAFPPHPTELLDGLLATYAEVVERTQANQVAKDGRAWTLTLQFAAAHQVPGASRKVKLVDAMQC
jgi:hypothetical protein